MRRLCLLGVVIVAMVVLAARPRGQSGVAVITNGTVTIGLDLGFGGTIVDLHTDTLPNPVNNFDRTGRQIQTALYDGNASYPNFACCGWNPTQGGDRWGHGSPVLESTITASSAYVRVSPLEWTPETLGGSSSAPMVSDITIEQWVSFVPDLPSVVRIDYRLTHFGTDTHATPYWGNSNSVPSIYVNLDYPYFTRYGGTAPWTGGAVTQSQLPDFSDSIGHVPDVATQIPIATTEQWASLVNAAGNGLTFYVPNQYPYAFGGWNADEPFQVNYFRPFLPFSVGPGEVRTSTVYVIVGSWQDARAAVNVLRQSAGPDTWPPMSVIDFPAEGATASGAKLTVSGWAFDNQQPGTIVRVRLDDQLACTTTAGIPRPDVRATWIMAPVNIGYSCEIKKLQSYARGAHRISLELTDKLGNRAVTADRHIVLQ